MMCGSFPLSCFLCAATDIFRDKLYFMNHFLKEKKAKACLFFFCIMKYFVPLIIITTSINTSCKISGLEILSTLLPFCNGFQCFSSLTAVVAKQLRNVFLRFLIQGF